MRKSPKSPTTDPAPIAAAHPGFERITVAAARTGLHPDTIRAYANQGTIGSLKVGLKKTLVRTADVDLLVTTRDRVIRSA